MDIAAGPLVILISLVIVTFVGHGIWILIASLFRPPGEERCLRCGALCRQDTRTCSACGLDRLGRVAAELADLKATRRQLQRFHQRDELPAVVLKRVRRAVELRRGELTGVSPEPEKEAAPEEVLTALPAPRPAEAAEKPLGVRLEELLARCTEVRALTPSARVNALIWYGQTSADQLQSLSAPAKLALARLLHLVGKIPDALRMYRLFVEAHPQDVHYGTAALEAGRLAVTQKLPNEARWFLEQALTGVLSAQAWQEAESLLRSLGQPEEAATPAFVPVPQRAATIPATAPSVLAPAEEKTERVPPREPVVPPPRRRSLGELLAGFMEDRNILWGELVGGLLIVGCSIALVISLWHTLEENPYTPFFIFFGISTALFGAGLYTLHHWKLEATSRGLLVIATLLVPLNFLVLPSVLSEATEWRWVEPLIAGVALIAYTGLISLAGRVLTPQGRWLLPVAVLGPAIGPILAASFLSGSIPALGQFLLLGSIPVACHGLSVGGVVGRLSRRQESLTLTLKEEDARGLFLFLGMATFALLVALGFLIFNQGDFLKAMHQAAVLVALTGIPTLASGLLVHQGLAQNSEAAASRTAGTGLALGGILLMFLAVALAWPEPYALLVVCALNFIILTLAALYHRLPLAHAAALPCLVLAFALLVHLSAGHLQGIPASELGPRLLEWLVSTWTGSWLVVLVVLLGIVAEVLVRSGLREQGAAYAIGSLATALASLILVTGQGIAQPQHAALVYGLYAAGCLALNFRWRRPYVSYLGLTLLLGTTLWVLRWSWPHDYPLWSLLIAAEGFVLSLLAAACGLRRSEAPTTPRWALMVAQQPALVDFLGRPLARSAEAIGLAAALLGILSGVRTPWLLEHVLAGGYLVALYLTLTIREARLWPARLIGVMLLGTVVAAAGWAGTSWEMDDLQALIGLCLAVTSMGMAGVTVWAARSAAPAGESTTQAWYRVLVHAWRETTAAAALLALLLTLTAPTFPDMGLYTYTGLALAATAFLLAWKYRAISLTWCGAGLLLATLVHALAWNFEALNPVRLLILALLIHATLVLLAGLALVRLGKADPFGIVLQKTFGVPLQHSALLSTLLTLPLFAVLTLLSGVMNDSPMPGLALDAAWLGGLWLVMALSERRPGLYAAFQAALTLSLFYATTAWLEGRPWIHDLFPDLLSDVRCLQVYGIALAVLSLVWAAARLRFRSREWIRQLLEHDWPIVDRVLLAWLVFGQLFLALWGILPELAQGALSPVPASGPAAWLLLGALAVVLTLTLWERRDYWEHLDGVFGLVLLAVTIPVLLAGWFAEERASGAALRWGLGTCFLACSVLLWLRDSLAQLARRLHMPVDPQLPRALAVRQMLLGFTVAPLLLLTFTGGTLVFNGIAGTPLPDTFFARIGWVASYVIPLAMVVVGLTGHALRETSPRYAFAAGLVLNVAVMGGYALGVVTSRQPFDTPEWVEMIQLGTLTATLWGLLWLLSRRWVKAWAEGPQTPQARPYMDGQLGMAVAGNLLLLLTSAWLLIDWYPPVSAWVQTTGLLLGWVTFLLTLAVGLWYFSQRFPHGLIHLLGASGLALGVLAAATASLWDTGDWLANHVWLLAWTVLGLLFLAIGGKASRREVQTFPAAAVWRWVEGICFLLVCLALRWAGEGPGQPYWSGGITLAVSFLLGIMALWSRRSYHVYASGLLVNVAGSIVWSAWGEPTLLSFGYTNILCLALASSLWTMLEVILRRGPATVDPRGQVLHFRHVAAAVALELLTFATLLGVLSDLFAGSLHVASPLGWTALAATFLALLLSLWDAEAKFALAGLYSCGLVAIGLTLHAQHLPIPDLYWIWPPALAGYLLFSTGAAWLLPRLKSLWTGLHLPERSSEGATRWFWFAQVTLTVLVLLGSLPTSVAAATFAERSLGALAMAVLMLAWILLAEMFSGRMRIEPRFLTLAFGVVALVEAGWALVDPARSAPVLHRSVWLMVALAVMSPVYGVGLARLLARFPNWAAACRRNGPVLAVLASVVLLVVLGQEGVLYDTQTRRTPMDLLEVIVVTVGLMVLITAGISFAIQPERDPFGLSERGRTVYVYAAEVLLALTFVHLRLNIPGIIPQMRASHWALIIMAIAFLGVGLSELFQRKGLTVLAGPLQRTGIFLPLLPLLAFWARPPAEIHHLAEQQFPGARPMLAYLDNLPSRFDYYAMLWFLTAALYGVVAASRRSFGFALAAALAGNFGLWALLFYGRITFVIHPQLWLIPLALVVLVAEHLNRDRLNPAQSAGLRYLAILMIYVSSTADMFIAGLDNVAFALILAVLAVLGVLAGILLRVRAFLFLGVSFLFLVIFTRVWHAAVDRAQTWVWWASGIVLGAAILTLFAIFEKRRNDVLRLIEELKKWK
jgi:hypothetical protein